MAKRRLVASGVNAEGHPFRRYDDGAYAYRNVDPETNKTISTYYDNGRGTAFYCNFRLKYSFIHNLKTGSRNYKSL